MFSILKRLVQPLTLKVCFKEAYWDITRTQARCWIGGALAADFLAQWLVGKPSAITILGSLLTLAMFWAVPARLAGAVGGLYITQALVSIGVVSVAAHSGSQFVVGAAAYLWSAWCMAALVVLVLRYIRTPKALMCARS
jgi:hypothetical protein